MTGKSKIIYIVGSVVIGIVAMLIILFGLMMGGVLNFSGNKLVISSSSCEFVYNGERQTDGGWQIISGKLSNGHTVEAEVTGGQREAGSSINYLSVTVFDSNGADVTSNYDIEYRPGTLTVLTRPLTITTTGVEKTYDGEELSCGEWEITKGSLVKGHEISVSMSASITDAGEVDNSAEAEIYDGETDVTSNYSITYDEGVLKVNPIELHFITPTLSKTYDGEPLYSDPEDFQWVSGEILDGHKLVSMKVVGIITEVGEVENSVEIKIAAANGTDITYNYLAVIDSGTLTVRGFGITISTASSEKVYDGTPLTNPVWTLYEGTPLIEGHKITQLIMPASQTGAGSSPNEITQIVIVNGKGEDVTGNYEINYSIGTLVVLPRPVTVQSGSASKEYDGKPLTCNEWKFTSHYGAVTGQWAEVIISGTITEPGQRDNTIAQVIFWDTKGNDLTANYDITLDEGLLIVKGGGSGPNSGDLDESGNISGGSNTGGDGESSTALGVKTSNGGLVYLRLKSFGDYNGSKWSEATEYSKTYLGYSFNYLTGYALESSGYSTENISIAVYGTGYYLPYYMTVAGNYDVQTSDVYNRGSSSNYSLGYYAYDYLSAPQISTLSGLEINDYNAFVHANYTAVPQTTKAYLQSVISAQGWKSTDTGLIAKIAAYVRGAAEYNLGYDRALDNESDIVLAFLRDYKEGICQHYASAATLLYRQLGIPARYTIGYVADTVADEWVEVTTDNAHAWVEIYLDNAGWVQIEVTGGSSAGGVFGGNGNGSGNTNGGGNGNGSDEGQHDFTVKPVTEYYKYDGRTIFSHSGALQGLSALTLFGYTYRADVSGGFKSPGKYSVKVNSFTLYDPQGKDVTEEFKISFKEGVLQVYQYEITISTGSAEKVYDGSAVSSAVCEIAIGHLAEGHRLEYFYTTASRTEVGVSINSYEIKIVDANGGDVTYKYKINSSYGLLSVSAREITVTAGSAEKMYDGTPLTCNEYGLSSGALAVGHRADVVVSGSNNGKAGTAENKIQSVKIVDASGNDVTANYKITTINGLLTVYPD
ncbi:MAG: transglutaminase-like domain-containing protein [Clostridia bacterium]|nr:transglutaminase-like domain-containing protein [Clostridia bacterium]